MVVDVLPIELPMEDLEDFCQRNGIVRMSLFGSALRDDFSESSDVDFLVTFHEHVDWGVFDLVRMRYELSDLLGRPVDLVERLSVERSQNPVRQRAILHSAVDVYERY
jgi:predicted nucleotidyltransferase